MPEVIRDQPERIVYERKWGTVTEYILPGHPEISISVERVLPGLEIPSHINRETETEVVFGNGWIIIGKGRQRTKIRIDNTSKEGGFIISPNTRHRLKADKEGKGLTILSISEPKWSGDVFVK